MPVSSPDGDDAPGKKRKKHARCSSCGARRVHLRVGSQTLECMACGTRTRQTGGP